MNNWHLTTFKVSHLFLLTALVIASCMGNPVSAQVTTSSILGSITDATDAAIQNASISVKDIDRNLTKTAKSNEQGLYRVDFLVAGNYTVSVSAVGFKTTAQSGISLSAGVRAQLTGLPVKGPRTVHEWFNISAFAQNPAVAGKPVNGNSPPNFINVPRFAGIDLTLARTFPIHDQINFQFRVEGGNAFNIVSYGSPGSTVNTGTFGVITSAASTQRQIQIGGNLTSSHHEVTGSTALVVG